MKKKKQQIQNPRRQQAWLIKERERITEPWRLAIFKLREQLGQECLSHSAERRRFQNRRLIENLFAEIESPKRGERNPLMFYWLFCGSPWQDELGFNEARHQHYAELKMRGLPPEFDPPEFQPKSNPQRIVTEFIFRLDSLASWIEAQESWIFWKMLTNRPGAVWNRDDPPARRQAMDAVLVARLPTITDGISDWLVAGIVESFRTWTKPQWINILKVATRIAERGEEAVTDLDTWVWWRYPIFSRYRWSVAEVCRAAKKRFGDTENLDNEAAFQSAWVRRGLRFTGKRRRRRLPPLWDLVTSEPVPKNATSGYSMLTWIPYGKSPSRS